VVVEGVLGWNGFGENGTKGEAGCWRFDMVESGRIAYPDGRSMGKRQWVDITN
jgi:hypothetical protein